MDKTITIANNPSIYNKSMKWHVVIATSLGRSSNHFKTRKEAEYFADRMKDSSYSKYERNNTWQAKPIMREY